MKPVHKYIGHQFDTSFGIERFDRHRPCEHRGLHLHNGYEIVYVKNGNGKVMAGDRKIDYFDGTLVMFGPNIPHYGFSNTTYPDNFEIVVHFDETFARDRLNCFPEFQPIADLIQRSGHFLIFDSQTKQELASSFNKIHSVNPTRQLLMLLEILEILSNSPNQSQIFREAIGDRFAQSSHINRVIEFINGNFDSQISTKDVAREIGLTTNSLCRLFKKATGKSFIDYLNDYRIHRAARLLEETDHSISKIMQNSGFENPSYFSRVFIRRKGLSPMEYRRGHRRKPNI